MRLLVRPWQTADSPSCSTSIGRTRLLHVVVTLLIAFCLRIGGAGDLVRSVSVGSAAGDQQIY